MSKESRPLPQQRVPIQALVAWHSLEPVPLMEFLKTRSKASKIQ